MYATVPTAVPGLVSISSVAAQVGIAAFAALSGANCKDDRFASTTQGGNAEGNPINNTMVYEKQ